MAPAFVQETKVENSRIALRLIMRLVQMYRHDLLQHATVVSLNLLRYQIGRACDFVLVYRLQVDDAELDI